MLARVIAFFILAALMEAAFAQQPQPTQADMDVLRRAVQHLQTQRNAAMDDAVNLRVIVDRTSEELQLARNAIQELQAKLPKEPLKEEPKQEEKKE